MTSSFWKIALVRPMFLLFLSCHLSLGIEPPTVSLIRTPNDGIQPQAAMGQDGVMHLIYFKGDAYKGDIFYVRRETGQEVFSKPTQVNRSPGSAIAAGTIRGAQMALGKNGRVHVVWNGPVPENGNHMDAPMLYTRLNEEGTAFEPERDVINFARGLDGGGSVAADDQGYVYVFWHAPKPGHPHDEAGRGVFVARSTDDGNTFAPEKLAISKPTGACGCCGLKAFADSKGNVYALFRTATETVNRDETLLISRNHGEDFHIAYAHGWKLNACPMSSAFLSESESTILAAAETHGKVYFIRLDPESGATTSPVSPPEKGKHPVVVGNEKGEVLLAWTEGTGWAEGGSLTWQIYNAAGKPIGEKGNTEGVPVWSLVAAVAQPDGNFVIIY